MSHESGCVNWLASFGSVWLIALVTSCRSLSISNSHARWRVTWTNLYTTLGQDQGLPRQETAHDRPHEGGELANTRVRPRLGPALDAHLDELAHLALAAVPRVARGLDLADKALALVRVDDAAPAAAGDHGVETVRVGVAALVADARHAHLVRDPARPPQEDGHDLEDGEVDDPVGAAPDLFEEREREIRFGVDRVGLVADVAEDDDADNARDDDACADEVEAGDGNAREEVGEDAVEDERGRAERRDVLGAEEFEREGRTDDLRRDV